MCIGEKVNELVFEVTDYGPDGEKEMWEDISEMLRILTKNGEVCTFECEEDGIYVIQHASDNREFGGPLPIWMTEDDYYNYKFKSENEELV